MIVWNEITSRNIPSEEAYVFQSGELRAKSRAWSHVGEWKWWTWWYFGELVKQNGVQ